jgi:ribosomal protein L7Ae-like RNA K-turn-binding protein
MCFRMALKPTKLMSAFKQPITVPTFEAVCQAAVSLLQERLNACFGLARKAGAVVSGYASLRTSLAHAKVDCLVLAEDIAASRAEEYYGWCVQQDIPYVTLFSKEEMGKILGRPSCSAAGFTSPRFCKLLYATIASLGRLRSPNGVSTGVSGLFQPPL